MSWLALLIPFFSAFTYRGRGGGFFYMPRPLWQIACALPFSAFALANMGWADGLGVLVFTTLAMLFGHASHQDVGRLEDGVPADGETFEWYSSWLPVGWGAQLRDIVGLSLSGMLIFLPLALAAALWGGPLWGLLVLGGLTKAAAYEAAWALYDRDFVKQPILWAELGFGLAAGCVIVVAFII